MPIFQTVNRIRMISEKEKKSLPMRASQPDLSEAETTQSFAPPAFQLSATQSTQGVGSGPIQKKEPKPMKDHKKDVEYGPNRNGDIATKGAGDAHAFAANDVNQGMLGDCYLLASLMALAMQQPSVLKDAISGPQSDGTYDVRLYKKSRGKFTAQTVNVSPSFIVDKNTQYEYYAHGGDTDKAGNEELWVKLIEKAYAKMHGSFDKIDGGWEENALEALTGKENEQNDFGGGWFGIGKWSDDDLKNGVVNALKSGQAVCASTMSESTIKKADKEEKGFAKMNDIVGHHAYAVVSATDSHIRVRNPWGDAAANPEPEMTWKQFRKYFSEFTTQKS